MKNAVNWFEIPVMDIDRAQKFYEAILQTTLVPMDMGDVKMRMFPVDNMEDPDAVSGALILAGEYNSPASTGTLVYLNANPDVQLVMDRVEAAGGKVAFPKTLISDQIGYMAAFIDSEGNRVALHAGPQA